MFESLKCIYWKKKKYLKMDNLYFPMKKLEGNEKLNRQEVERKAFFNGIKELYPPK